MRRLIAAALVTLPAILLGCSGSDEDAAAGGAPVALSRVEALDIIEHIGSTGELLAVEHAEIAAEVAGRITEVVADEGAAVEAGGEVLGIDPERRTLQLDSARARVDEARAQLREQEREFKRVTDLHARKVASRTQLDQGETAVKLARSRLLAAKADLGGVERALRDARVTAPFAGLVARRMVSRGEYVQPGQSLFELVALDPIEVEFSVTEADSGRVAIDQVVDVRLAPFPDETFAATVHFVSPTIDTRTRTLRVKARLDNPGARLRPGLFARVDLGISERDGVPMIPEDAVLQRAEGEIVFRAVADERVERVLIETGVHRRGMVEVVSGLRAGEWIVSRGQSWLADGQKVVARHADGTRSGAGLPAVAGQSTGEESGATP